MGLRESSSTGRTTRSTRSIRSWSKSWVRRWPRLIGLQAALDLILSGRRLNARRARLAGLLDDVVHPTVLDLAARVWASKPKRPLDRPLHLGLNVKAAIDVAELTPAGRQL